MTEQIERTRVVFPSVRGTCIGYLYRPTDASGSLPCVMMGTGFGGMQDTPSIIANARSFAQRPGWPR